MTRRVAVAIIATVVLVPAGLLAGLAGNDALATWCGAGAFIAAGLAALFDGLDHQPDTRPGYPADHRRRLELRNHLDGEE